MANFIFYLGYFIKDFYVAFNARVQFFSDCSQRMQVKVFPVKLSQPENNFRKKHVDCYFAMASVKHLRELASLFSDENVFFPFCG